MEGKTLQQIGLENNWDKSDFVLAEAYLYATRKAKLSNLISEEKREIFELRNQLKIQEDYYKAIV